MYRRCMLVLGCLLWMPWNISAQTIKSTFDTGLEGWTTSSGGSITFSAVGGNPGGFLQQVDLDLQDMFVMTPAPFLGDLASFHGGTFSFDVMQIIGTADYSPFGIVIFGTARTLSLPISFHQVCLARTGQPNQSF